MNVVVLCQSEKQTATEMVKHEITFQTTIIFPSLGPVKVFQFTPKVTVILCHLYPS